MTAKKAVYEILSSLQPGTEISGNFLKTRAYNMTGKQLYPATALRHLRSYRDEKGVQIINVNKRRSIYRVI